MLHNVGGGLIQDSYILLYRSPGSLHSLETTLHSLQHTYRGGLPSTINSHNTELQMVMVHINNTKHMTIANIDISPKHSTSTHYKTAYTDIQQYITNECQTPHYNKHHHQISPRCLTHCTTRHRGHHSTRTIIRPLTHHYHN